MKILNLILIYCIYVTACKSSLKQDKLASNIEFKKDSSKPRIIRLYKVDSAFLPYMPDTSLTFASSKELRNYFFLISKKFDSAKAILDFKSVKDKNLVTLSKRNASIFFDDLMEVVYFKFYKKAPKDNQNMGSLSFYSPYSNIIPLKERLDFYNTFPEKIQKNEIGQKTWNKFMEYSFDKNIDANLYQYDNLQLTDSANRKKYLKNIFSAQYKYYILVFGASWCYPCRLEEKQLKYWTPFIDTSQINIIGLSIDKDFTKWEKYLEEDKLPWNCYLLQGEMNNELVKSLRFEGVPRNFLLDAKGKVLAENTDIRKILKQIPFLNTE